MEKDSFRYHTPQQAAVVHHPKGFWGNLGRSFQVYNWVGQLATHGVPAGWLHQPVAGYRVTEDPQFKGDMDQMRAAIQAGSESPAESAELIRRYQFNRRLKQQIETDGSWVAPIAAGVLDPINLIPVPGMLGQGLVRGAIRGGVGIGATGALSEGLRAHLDPSMTPTEAAVNMGAAAVIGTGLGATLGRFTRLPRWAKDPIGRAARAYDNAIQGGTEFVDETFEPTAPRADVERTPPGQHPSQQETPTQVVDRPGAELRGLSDDEIDYNNYLKEREEAWRREQPVEVEPQHADLIKTGNIAYPKPAMVDTSEWLGKQPARVKTLPDGTTVVEVNKDALRKHWDVEYGDGGQKWARSMFETFNLKHSPPKTFDEFVEFTGLQEWIYTELMGVKGARLKALSKNGGHVVFHERAAIDAMRMVRGEETKFVKVKPRGYTSKSNHLQKLRTDAETMQVENVQLAEEIKELKARRAAGQKTVKWTEGKDLSPDEVDAALASVDEVTAKTKVKGTEDCAPTSGASKLQAAFAEAVAAGHPATRGPTRVPFKRG